MTSLNHLSYPILYYYYYDTHLLNQQDVGLRSTNLRRCHVCDAVCRSFRHHGLRLHQGNHDSTDILPSQDDFSVYICQEEE